MTKNAPKNLLDQANDRFFLEFFSDQQTSKASGGKINADFYQVKISKLPDNFKTAADLLAYIRTNFGQFVNGDVTDFEPYDEGENKVWTSSNPNSAVIRFSGKLAGVNVDNADVLTTNFVSTKDYASWTFRPITDNNVFHPAWAGDKGHPLAGNREFGIQKQDGGYIFYIQGIDRLWSVADVLTISYKDYFFKKADELWQQVMNNVANKINSLGGQATFDTQGIISKRVNYSDLPKAQRDQIRNSGN